MSPMLCQRYIDRLLRYLETDLTLRESYQARFFRDSRFAILQSLESLPAEQDKMPNVAILSNV